MKIETGRPERITELRVGKATPARPAQLTVSARELHEVVALGFGWVASTSLMAAESLEAGFAEAATRGYQPDRRVTEEPHSGHP
jgi:hypothetical protein